MFKAKLMICIAIIAVVFCGPVRYYDGDSRFTLLGSEALIHHGTFALDSYCDKYPLCHNDYRVTPINGHYYYNFPIGTALISAPFVAAANALGFDVMHHEAYFQRILSSVSIILVFLWFNEISVIFMSPKQALFLSSAFVFGTGIMSTMGSALWSIDFAMFFSTLTVYLVLAGKLLKKFETSAIASCLYVAYLCRPTLILLIPIALLFIATHDFKSSLKVLAFFAAEIAIFILYSYSAFGQFLPPYYMPSRLSNPEFMTALYGHLFSASRGLFIFSPFLVAFLFLCNFKKACNNFTFFFGFLWPLLHLITVAKFPDWWGGYSFGARLMVDCLPGVFVFVASGWRESNIKNIPFLITVILSFYIHTWKGKFDIESAINWNKTHLPAKPGDATDCIFDWRNSQVLN